MTSEVASLNDKDMFSCTSFWNTLSNPALDPQMHLGSVSQRPLVSCLQEMLVDHSSGILDYLQAFEPEERNAYNGVHDEHGYCRVEGKSAQLLSKVSHENTEQQQQNPHATESCSLPCS